MDCITVINFNFLNEFYYKSISRRTELFISNVKSKIPKLGGTTKFYYPTHWNFVFKEVYNTDLEKSRCFGFCSFLKLYWVMWIEKYFWFFTKKTLSIILKKLRLYLRRCIPAGCAFRTFAFDKKLFLNSRCE